MAKRKVRYMVVTARDGDVGPGAPGFRATWQSKDDLKRQLLERSGVPNNGTLEFWDDELWLNWDDEDLPGPEGDPLRIRIVCLQGAGSGDAWREEMKRDMAQLETTLRALINKPSVISTSTVQELGSLANKKAKLEGSLQQAHALAWDSPIWAQVTTSNVPLLEAEKGGQQGLQSLFADLLPTAPTNTPFVFHDVHTRPSVCGNDLKPDIVMALRNKPCVPLTTAAIIDIKRQGGGYDNDENVGKAIIYGKVFLQQLPRTLRRVVTVGLTDLLSITLILVRLDDHDGSEQLDFNMFPRFPDVKDTLLSLLGSEPQSLFVQLPDLGASIQAVGLLGFGATSHVYEVVEGGQQVVAKVPFPSQNLLRECTVLQSLQGIAGIPNLVRDQCVGASILMRPVLDPIAHGAFFAHDLHKSLPSLVQLLKAAHCKLFINRDVRPNNLMHTESQIFLVDWGSATLQQTAPYEGTVHYASIGVLHQLSHNLDSVAVGPADDLESLVASMFCISHPDAHSQLQKVDKLPEPVMQWWETTWSSRVQWQLALTAARAVNYDNVATCLLALLE